MAFGSFIQATLASNSSGFPLQELSRTYNTIPISARETPINTQDNEPRFQNQEAVVVDFKNHSSQDHFSNYDSEGSLLNSSLQIPSDNATSKISEPSTTPQIASYTQSGYAVATMESPSGRLDIAA